MRQESSAAGLHIKLFARVTLAAILSLLPALSSQATQTIGGIRAMNACASVFSGAHEKRTGFYDRQTGRLVVDPKHPYTYTEAIANLPFNVLRKDLSPRLRPLALKMRKTKAAQAVVGFLDRFAEIEGKRDTSEHSYGVAALAVKIGRVLGLDHTMQVSLFYSALGHDLGKAYISNEILLKPGRLTPEERATMEQHTAYNERFFNKVITGRPDMNVHDIFELAYYEVSGRDHHERFDGQGYPQKLKGEEIALESRILAIADVFQALLADRPYKPAKSLREAIEIVENNMTSMFDPKLLGPVLVSFKAELDDGGEVSSAVSNTRQPNHN